MPGENIQDWSTTAASNSNSDSSIDWAEGQSRASVNNSARSMMAAHAKQRNLQNSSIVTGGTANAQTFFSGLNYSTVPTGLRVLLKIGPGLTNTGAATLEMDGLGAVAIKDQLGADLAAGVVMANTCTEFIYSGTNWILLGVLTTTAPASHDNSNRIATTGWVYNEFQTRPMFRANTAVAQAVGIGAPQTVLFATEDHDIGGFFASSAWVPPAGRILLTTTLTATTTDPSGCIVSIGFWKNVVATTLGQYLVLAATGGFALGATTFTAMDVADGVTSYTVVVTFDRGGAVTAGIFSGMLM